MSVVGTPWLLTFVLFLRALVESTLVDFDNIISLFKYCFIMILNYGTKYSRVRGSQYNYCNTNSIGIIRVKGQ